jgi:pimeloyl-ACP methyl ester carboxylesterase
MIQPITGTSSPLSYCTAPIDWISEKVTKAVEAVFGYMLRIITFQMGEMNAWGASTIIRIYQKFSSDPREEKPFDPARLEKSTQLLKKYGGKVDTVLSGDGEKIRYMTFKSTDFFEAFRQQGSERIDVNYEGKLRKALLNPPLEDAAKFFLPIVDLRFADGSIKQAALLPEACASPNPPHIFHSGTAARALDMERRFIGLHLAAGYDITLWDPRGTYQSTGKASVGGYYLDAEAVLAKVREQVATNRIYVSGYCKGAALACHLKKKFHAEGINLVISNAYTSMKEVVEGYGWIGRLAARYGLNALKDPNLSIPQDDFDNVEKLRNLPLSNGKCVFIHTDTDQMMPPNTVAKLTAAFANAGPVQEILRKHPNPEENGHMQPPYEDPNVWIRYIQAVV